MRPPTNERKGIILNPPVRKLLDEEKGIFESCWDIVDAPTPNHKSSPPLCCNSIWLSINTLMLNPDTIIVEESEKNTIQYLESQGLKVIQCAFRDFYEFGGSFHCATTDIRRRGEMKSYFTNLD